MKKAKKRTSNLQLSIKAKLIYLEKVAKLRDGIKLRSKVWSKKSKDPRKNRRDSRKDLDESL